VLPRLGEGYRLAHWLTGNAADAEDVMEACLRAYRAIENWAVSDLNIRDLRGFAELFRSRLARTG
jgi:DNA-directed RNA polymerase specialized sigma24 family protein